MHATAPAAPDDSPSVRVGPATRLLPLAYRGVGAGSVGTASARSEWRRPGRSGVGSVGAASARSERRRPGRSGVGPVSASAIEVRAAPSSSFGACGAITAGPRPESQVCVPLPRSVGPEPRAIGGHRRRYGGSSPGSAAASSIRRRNGHPRCDESVAVDRDRRDRPEGEFRVLLPLDGRRRFRADVVDDPVDARDLVDDA